MARSAKPESVLGVDEINGDLHALRGQTVWAKGVLALGASPSAVLSRGSSPLAVKLGKALARSAGLSKWAGREVALRG